MRLINRRDLLQLTGFLLAGSQLCGAEPFLDYLAHPEPPARSTLAHAPNAACLSDAQCAMLRRYFHDGGTLLATHLTSLADEHGRMRSSFGLADLFGAIFAEPEPVAIPDFYLKLRVYAESRMKPVRGYLASPIDPGLAPHRAYELEFQSSVMPHLSASTDTRRLRLLADTGNKWKSVRSREEFLPVESVQARIRVPPGRRVRSVSRLRAGSQLSAALRDGWVEVTVPRVFIHEAGRVDLA